MWPGSASECDSGATHYGGASAVDLHHASLFQPDRCRRFRRASSARGAIGEPLYRPLERRSTGRTESGRAQGNRVFD